VYCDGVGIFLAKIDGAPAPQKLVLFSYVDFPPGTIGGRYFGQGKWSDVYVYRDGCVPDGKCESIARGKVWIDDWDTSETGGMPPKRISGKYEIDLSGKQLKGSFVARERSSKHTRRLCMWQVLVNAVNVHAGIGTNLAAGAREINPKAIAWDKSELLALNHNGLEAHFEERDSELARMLAGNYYAMLGASAELGGALALADERLATRGWGSSGTPA
jgi:hypothetical protein